MNIIDNKATIIINGVSKPFRIESFETPPFREPRITGFIDLIERYNQASSRSNSKIKEVIFNNPATIVIWNDGSKTVVKCQEGDTYSKELGLAMCMSKKFLGNKGNFNEVFKKYIKESEE